MQRDDDKLRALSLPGACQCGCSGDWAVSFESVSVDIGGVPILDSVDAKVPRGGCTAIVGPNGAGKTTLVMSLLGEVSYSGAIRVAGGRDGRAPKLGYVPQRLSFDRDMPLTVMEFLCAGAQRTPFWFGVRRKFRDAVMPLLESVECAHLERRPLGALSGGELQRALLALAISQDPDILILDEPAAGVDLKGEQVCCMLLEKFRKERGFTQLMVSHDLATVEAHATHVICLNKRVYASGLAKDVLVPQVLSATFGLHMGVAVPMPGRQPCCGSGGKEARDA